MKECTPSQHAYSAPSGQINCETSGIPFTGQDLGPFAAVGALLLVVGVCLRVKLRKAAQR